MNKEQILKNVENLLSIQHSVIPNLVVIEGPDGVGKTTIAKSIVENLNAQDIKAKYVKEPGGTSLIGQAIRQVFIDDTEVLKEPHLMLPAFVASMILTLDTIINNPETLFIMDRYIESSIIYQYMVPFYKATSVKEEKQKMVYDFLTMLKTIGYIPNPNITYLLTRSDSKKVWESACENKNVFEKQGREYYNAVYNSYLEIIATYVKLPYNGSNYLPIEVQENELETVSYIITEQLKMVLIGKMDMKCFYCGKVIPNYLIMNNKYANYITEVSEYLVHKSCYEQNLELY